MEIFRFAKWWWNSLATIEKTLGSFLIWTLFNLINVTVTSASIAAATFFIGLGLAGLYYIAFTIFMGIATQWRKYRQIKDREAQEIVDRLKGVS